MRRKGKIVPLKVGEDKVGSAEIFEDGSMFCIINPSPLGIKLMEVIDSGSLDHLSVGPSFIPELKNSKE